MANRNANMAASAISPSSTAPIAAMVINRPTPSRPFLNPRSAPGTNVAPPTTAAAQNSTVSTTDPAGAISPASNSSPANAAACNSLIRHTGVTSVGVVWSSEEASSGPQHSSAITHP